MHHYFFLVTVSPILHWFIDHLFLANNDNGVTIDEVIAVNVTKLEKRYPGGSFDPYYSEHRAEDDL